MLPQHWAPRQTHSLWQKATRFPSSPRLTTSTRLNAPYGADQHEYVFVGSAGRVWGVRVRLRTNSEAKEARIFGGGSGLGCLAVPDGAPALVLRSWHCSNDGVPVEELATRQTCQAWVN
jgi:hypothetical protein